MDKPIGDRRCKKFGDMLVTEADGSTHYALIGETEADAHARHDRIVAARKASNGGVDWLPEYVERRRRELGIFQ